MNTWVSFSISIVAIVISGLTLYYKFLRGPKLIIRAAEKIGLWHGHGDFLMDIPTTITNEGARAGYIYQMGLIIENYHNVEERFFLKWDMFLRLDFSKNSWDPYEMASLISAPGNTTIFKYVKFGSDGSMKNWLPSPGKYVVHILGWSRKGDTPDLFDKFELNTDSQLSNSLRQNMEADNFVTTYYTRTDWGKWIPKKLSSVEFNNLTKRS